MKVQVEMIQQAIKLADFNKAAIRKALKPFVGKPGSSEEIRFGNIPTDKLVVETDEEGLITCIKWWSGLKWTAKSGYGVVPSVEVCLDKD